MAAFVPKQAGEDLASVEPEVEKPGTGDLDPDDFGRPLGARCDGFGDLPRGSLEHLGQRQGARPGEIAEVAPRRDLEGHLVGSVVELGLDGGGQGGGRTVSDVVQGHRDSFIGRDSNLFRPPALLDAKPTA